MHALTLRIILIIAIAMVTFIAYTAIAQGSRAGTDLHAEGSHTSSESVDTIGSGAVAKDFEPSISPGENALLRKLHEGFDHRLRTKEHAILASTGLAPLDKVARVADAARAKTLAYLLGSEVPSPGSRREVVPIVLCSTEADVDFLRDALAADGTRLPNCLPGLSGLYVRRNRMVVVMPDPHDVASTVAHEVSHSAISEILPNCACALDEGLAQHIPECLEELREESERERSGREFWRAVYLGRLLKSRGLPKLTDFVRLEIPLSPASERIQYHALAWCLVAAMRDMDRARGRAELRELFDRLRQGADAVASIDAIYGCASLSDAWSRVATGIVEAARSADPRRNRAGR